jgi:hypothetical protein
MPRSTLFRVFSSVNSVDQKSFHAVPSSRLASDDAGFVALTSLPSCVAGHNNILPGGVNEEAKEEICAASSGYREESKQHPDNTSGRVEEKSTTCGKATGQRGRLHSLVVQFFLNWHREAAQIDPERRHSFSSPRSSSAHRAQPCVQQPLAHVSAPSSPTLDEIHAKLICNLACVRYGAIWNISGKSFVLFQDEVTGSSLVLPTDSFDVRSVQAHIRTSREKFGIWEEL